jgi:hypothetical protein
VLGGLNSNFSLQHKEVAILEAREKAESFQEKLAPWGRRVKSRNFANFPLFD